MVMQPDGIRQRVLVGDSVYENAEITIREGRLYVEFETEDLDSVTIDLAFLGASVNDALERLEDVAEPLETVISAIEDIEPGLAVDVRVAERIVIWLGLLKVARAALVGETGFDERRGL